MKIFYIDIFTFPIPAGHRFPVVKYRLLRERIIASGWVPPGELEIPSGATDQELILCHDEQYVERFVAGSLTEKEIRRIGLPWSPEYVERVRRSVGGTVAAARQALVDGIAVHLSGGTHHACADHGQGFCVFNDAAVAVRVLQKSAGIRRTLIVDCDVHQGNGTASIFSNDQSTFTFSIHGQNNFPFRKIPGDLDIGLPDGTGDEEYLDVLEEGLLRAIAFSNPQLVIYLAGADAHSGDRLGRLDLSKSGLAARDKMVIECCVEAGIPIAVAMAGGYGRNIEDTVEIQANTTRIALDYWLLLRNASSTVLKASD
jgi:acetoin utilization deacetylase AcuC-like enzyme